MSDLQNLYVTNMPTDDTLDIEIDKSKGGQFGLDQLNDEIDAKKSELAELNKELEGVKSDLSLKMEQKNNLDEMLNLSKAKTSYSIGGEDNSELIDKCKELESELKNTKEMYDDSIELLTQTELENQALENKVADTQQEVEYMKVEKENMINGNNIIQDQTNLNASFPSRRIFLIDVREFSAVAFACFTSSLRRS